MNPWLPLAVLIALIVTNAGSFWYGGHVREAELIAQESKDKDLMLATREAAQQGAAEAIAKMKVNNVTIKQRVETEIREKPVYRDCVADVGVLDLVNEAITGQTQRANSGVVPGAGANDRPDVR